MQMYSFLGIGVLIFGVLAHWYTVRRQNQLELDKPHQFQDVGDVCQKRGNLFESLNHYLFLSTGTQLIHQDLTSSLLG